MGWYATQLAKWRMRQNGSCCSAVRRKGCWLVNVRARSRGMRCDQMQSNRMRAVVTPSVNMKRRKSDDGVERAD